MTRTRPETVPDLPKKWRGPTSVFYVAEGTNAKGETYESTFADSEAEDVFLMSLFIEFLEARKRGEARFMISSRENEDWK